MTDQPIAERKLRIGTRASPLALKQAEEVRDRLIAAHPALSAAAVELVPIKTKGDKILDRALAEVGGKGLFTEEIEQGLLDGSLDLAVHSMKDMPTELPPGLGITCLLPREDPRDAWLSPKADTLADLAAGSLVGTASLRRQAQILSRRPDLKVAVFRGNVQTRLRKLDDGVADATLLAVAGLKRLGMLGVAQSIFNPDQMLPAIGQGAIGIESRVDDGPLLTLLSEIHHPETETCLALERAFLAALDGSCRTPIAGNARLEGDRLVFAGEILSSDGAQSFTTTREGPVSDAVAMGRDAGEELRARAGPDFWSDLETGF
ncbi:MAG: hydroxymethylbilane synthase [Alphaproteobacteria bacterium]|nr:hydroxymethylbilane synthase [Alphaproteobacteria bacterium]